MINSKLPVNVVIFLICKSRSKEIIYINFLHSGLSTLGLYHEEIEPENFYSQWPARTKMQCMYQKYLKKVKVITST